MAERKLIDVDHLIDKDGDLTLGLNLDFCDDMDIIKWINEQPTVDAVEVVRRKECKFYSEQRDMCAIIPCCSLRGELWNSSCDGCVQYKSKYDSTPIIDPETLQIVQELREKLREKERNSQYWESMYNHAYSDCIIADKKLARYEKAEKDGRLFELPSRKIFESLGDSLYMIEDWEIIELTNCSVQIDADGVLYVTCCADDKIFPYREPIAEFDMEPGDWCTQYINLNISDFGKTVFLAREEAEAALKERENDG